MATTLRSSVRASVSAPQKVSIRPSKFVAAPARPARQGDELQTAFLGSNSLASSLCSAFAGLAVTFNNVRRAIAHTPLKIECNRKKGMQGNLQGATNKAKARTSGFRTRMETHNGKKVIKRRRVKGRKNLTPASIKPYK